jgi:hypothetical protein
MPRKSIQMCESWCVKRGPPRRGSFPRAAGRSANPGRARRGAAPRRILSTDTARIRSPASSRASASRRRRGPSASPPGGTARRRASGSRSPPPRPGRNRWRRPTCRRAGTPYRRWTARIGPPAGRSPCPGSGSRTPCSPWRPTAGPVGCLRRTAIGSAPAWPATIAARAVVRPEWEWRPATSRRRRCSPAIPAGSCRRSGRSDSSAPECSIRGSSTAVR